MTNDEIQAKFDDHFDLVIERMMEAEKELEDEIMSMKLVSEKYEVYIEGDIAEQVLNEGIDAAEEDNDVSVSCRNTVINYENGIPSNMRSLLIFYGKQEKVYDALERMESVFDSCDIDSYDVRRVYAIHD